MSQLLLACGRFKVIKTQNNYHYHLTPRPLGQAQQLKWSEAHVIFKTTSSQKT